jgi:hypothetical protein
MRRGRIGGRWLLFRFWIDLCGEIAPELWKTSLNMQRFWNELVALREDVAFNSETLPQDAETISKRFWNLLSGGNNDCKRWRKEVKEASGLNWEARDAVFDRFVTCCRQAAKNKRGWPRFRHRLERVTIPHRFKNGGVLPAALFTRDGGRAWRFGLEPVPQWAYQGKSRSHTNARLTKGFFGLSKATKIKFRTVLHRAFPAQALVKGVTLLGELHSVKGWQWAIAITLESANWPPARPTLPACGLDLGWRAMGDYIRIGMLYDSDENVAELRLPLRATTSHTRRHGLASDWRDISAMDARMARMVEDVKRRLTFVLPPALPDGATVLAPQFVKMRQGGLVRLLHSLEATGIAQEAQTLLRSWLAENDRLRKERAALQDRLIGRRRWLYRNLAAFLSRRYGTLALESQLSIKSLIEESEDMTPTLRHSRRYHQWAAVGELRRYLIEAGAKYGARIAYAGTSWSTVTCHVCGERAQGGAKPELICPRGHPWDQDVNAAINLLSEIEGVGAPKKGVEGSPLRSDVPWVLREVVVLQPLSLARVA